VHTAADNANSLLELRHYAQTKIMGETPAPLCFCRYDNDNDDDDDDNNNNNNNGMRWPLS